MYYIVGLEYHTNHSHPKKSLDVDSTKYHPILHHIYYIYRLYYYSMYVCMYPMPCLCAFPTRFRLRSTLEVIVVGDSALLQVRNVRPNARTRSLAGCQGHRLYSTAQRATHALALNTRQHGRNPKVHSLPLLYCVR